VLISRNPIKKMLNGKAGQLPRCACPPLRSAIMSRSGEEMSPVWPYLRLRPETIGSASPHGRHRSTAIESENSSKRGKLVRSAYYSVGCDSWPDINSRLAGIRRQRCYRHERGPTMSKFTEPGKWYFVVACLACNGPAPLAQAPSPDEKPDPLRYRTVTGVRCPHFGNLGAYVARQMSRRLVE
jgi:hypothetical protein